MRSQIFLSCGDYNNRWDFGIGCGGDVFYYLYTVCVHGSIQKSCFEMNRQMNYLFYVLNKAIRKIKFKDVFNKI